MRMCSTLYAQLLRTERIVESNICSRNVVVSPWDDNRVPLSYRILLLPLLMFEVYYARLTLGELPGNGVSAIRKDRTHLSIFFA